MSFKSWPLNYYFCFSAKIVIFFHFNLDSIISLYLFIIVFFFYYKVALIFLLEHFKFFSLGFSVLMKWNDGIECDSYFHSIHLLGVMEWMSEWMKMQRKSKEIVISFLSSFHSNLYSIPPSFHSIIPSMP